MFQFNLSKKKILFRIFPDYLSVFVVVFSLKFLYLASYSLCSFLRFTFKDMNKNQAHLVSFILCVYSVWIYSFRLCVTKQGNLICFYMSCVYISKVIFISMVTWFIWIYMYYLIYTCNNIENNVLSSDFSTFVNFKIMSHYAMFMDVYSSLDIYFMTNLITINQMTAI